MPTSHCILIASQDQSFAKKLISLLEERGFQAELAATAGDALFLLEKKLYQLVLFEEGLQGTSGLELLERLREQSLFTPLMVLASPNQWRNAPEELKKGAFDLREKPAQASQLLPALESALSEATLHHAVQYLRHEQHYIYDLNAIPAAGPAMADFMESLRRAAAHQRPVLFVGEPGSGKNFFAGALHFNSPRREGPMVTVNCAAIPERILGEELFGYAKGTGPGRKQARSGRCQQAHGGSLCLEVVEALPLDLQRQIAGAVKNKYFLRRDEGRQVPVDLRLIATSETGLGQKEGAGRLDPEFQQLVADNTLGVPPLRERLDDLPVLAERFLRSSAAKLNRQAPGLTSDFLGVLAGHDWPGNLHELKNLMELCAIASHGEELDGEAALRLLGQASGSDGGPADEARPTTDTLNLKDLERQAIIAALEKNDWVQKDAAAELGVTERTMTYKLNKLGIRHPRFRARHRRSQVPKLESS